MLTCMCKYINKISSNTKFILLMHPKEFRKTKNGSGHFTHKSLKNSEIHIGIDFTTNKRINELIDDTNNACYILYPGHESLLLNKNKPQEKKNLVLFLIDSTWACSKKMLRVSKNLARLPRMSFTHNKSSQFIFKTQPAHYCLSTMESTLCILELLNIHGIENIKNKELEGFLEPFTQIVKYQFKCIPNNEIRYKKPFKKSSV